MEEETRQVVFETNGKTYKELYDNIIEENLRNPPLKGENTIEHHIMPRSISPDLIYSRENLVRLTEKVHLLVHYLLWQHYKNETDDRDSERKMCTAFWNMIHEIEWRGDTELGWIADKYEELRVDFRKNHPMKRPEARAKLSEAWKNPNVRAKMLEAKNGAMKRPEIRAKISEATKNPKTREKLSEAMKGDNNPMKNPEVRAKFMGENNPRSKKVLQFAKDGTFLAEFSCTREAERKTNVQNANISLCCRGKLKTAGGYVWKYAESK